MTFRVEIRIANVVWTWEGKAFDSGHASELAWNEWRHQHANVTVLVDDGDVGKGADGQELIVKNAEPQ